MWVCGLKRFSPAASGIGIALHVSARIEIAAREFLLGEYRIPTWGARIEVRVRWTAKKRLLYSLFFDTL